MHGLCSISSLAVSMDLFDSSTLYKNILLMNVLYQKLFLFIITLISDHAYQMTIQAHRVCVGTDRK